MTSLRTPGFDTTSTMVSSATNAGEMLAAGWADLALMPQTFSPYPSQMLAWYTSNLGPPGKNGSENWTGFSDPQFDQLVLTASRQLFPNTAATYYQQADTRLWDEMVSLPLYPEPSALVWSRTIGGVTPTPLSDSLLWYAQQWAVRQAGVDQQHHAVLAGPVGRLRPESGRRASAPADVDRSFHCGALTFSDA